MEHQIDEVLPNSYQLEPLTVDSVRRLWSKTYNTEGKTDWSHLFPYL